MPTTSLHKNPVPVNDRHALQALGVLMPIRLSPLTFLPGRHPLGRAGSGLRFLRTRLFQQGEDNPRDIDKFSPQKERQVIEWEEESQAQIMLLADASASMALPDKASLRNATVLQLTYSLWRAGDRVGTVFFSSSMHGEVRAANLKMQMERLTSAFGELSVYPDTDILTVLKRYIKQTTRKRPDMVFVISDFVSMQASTLQLDSEWSSVLNQLRSSLIPVIITFAIPDGVRGMMKLWDPERRSRRLAWFSSNRVNRINQEEQERIAALVQKFRAAGLDYLIISGQREIYPQLAQLARQRRRRKN
jgi:uncharacterized protein (DUF58 family)